MYSLKALHLTGKKVLLRLDLDLPDPLDSQVDTWRMDVAVAAVSYLLKRGVASVHILAHRGQPKGKLVKKYSLEPIFTILLEKIGAAAKDKVTIAENVLFNPGEEAADKRFAKTLAKGFDLYVVEAFSVAHKNWATTIILPTLLPTVAGRQFERELKMVRKTTFAPARPLTLILGGNKQERLEYLMTLFEHANVLLVGGALIGDQKEEVESTNRKAIIGELDPTGMDLTLESREQFDRFIKASESVVWAGQLGLCANPETSAATKVAAVALAKTKIVSVILGDELQRVLLQMGFPLEHFNHVSTGSEAFLQFLANQSLPGVTALEEGQKLFAWEKDLEFVL